MIERHGGPIEGLVAEHEHPLRGMWLAYCSLLGTGIDPFKSIMDIPATEAEQILEQATTAGRKFESSHIQERRRAEAWLKTKGEAKGLQPAADHPLYFRLHSEPSRVLRTPGTALVNIPAARIPAEVMTFTYDDSFHNFLQLLDQPSEYTPPNLQPAVFTADEVKDRLNAEGFPTEFDGRNRRRYIEGQVWARELPIFLYAGALLIDAIQEGQTTVTVDAAK
jgi:hypothetical protein